MMKIVLTYDTSSSSMEEIMRVFPRHKQYLEDFKKQNIIIGIGPFKDRKDSMGIFLDIGTATKFSKDDPFVLEGIAKDVQIRELAD
jgi:uncharacterized protein YciI